jgi:hypothetical protein
MGVLLVGWTFRAGADDIVVTAEVHAPLPSGPAVIEVPTDGAHFSAVPITVSGSCPADGTGAYIKLYRNNAFSGTAICNVSNHFELQSDLFPGANKLMAKIFNKTDDPGPDSNTPIVYYDVPIQPTQPSQPGLPVAQAPFLITTNFHYVGYHVGQSVKWELVITGGNAPYALNVDWGDGTNSVLSRKAPGTFTVEHRYSQEGNADMSSYKIKIKGSDADGRQAFLQLFAVVNPGRGSLVGPIQLPPNNWLWVAWPAYLVILLMATSYWLGEREELLNLRRAGRLRQRRS